MRWPARTETERFEAFIGPSDANGCLLWTGGTCRGYGAFRAKRDGKWKMLQTHRYAWEAVNGPVPDGLFVCHRCDVRACVNVEHFFLGTCADNLGDMRDKGRGSAPPSPRGRQPGNTKLTDGQVLEIRRRYAAGGVLQRELAVEFGVDQVNISCIITRKSWAHL